MLHNGLYRSKQEDILRQLCIERLQFVSDYISPITPDMSAPRYSGLATFMRAPIAQTLENIDIGMVGIPYDGALTNRPGARHGPREVRNQSSLIILHD